jgi:type III secretion protein R
VTGGVGNVALLAALAFAPFVVLALTSFVKISVVLSLVRNALGTPDAPSGLVITGLALVLTFFVMTPVVIDMTRAAAAPAVAAVQPADPASLGGALRAIVPDAYRADVETAERAIEPLRAFLVKHAGERDVATFVELAAKLGHPANADALWVVAPAFVASELRRAFVMAILIFLPFLVIDLVVGLGLASLGLATTSAQTVALPLKLLLFVAVDGWRMLLDALVRGYA